MLLTTAFVTVHMLEKVSQASKAVNFTSIADS